MRMTPSDSAGGLSPGDMEVWASPSPSTPQGPGEGPEPRLAQCSHLQREETPTPVSTSCCESQSGAADRCCLFLHEEGQKLRGIHVYGILPKDRSTGDQK